ncbi:MAG: DNA methylase [Armatimonadetes bacterium]|nr:DNA methylase [Armatimonadota bacterium]
MTSPLWKTISFPAGDSGTGGVERVRLATSERTGEGFGNWLRTLASRDARTILGASYVSLVAQAAREGRSLANLVTFRLHQHYLGAEDLSKGSLDTARGQMGLFAEQQIPGGRHGTFAPNYLEAVHRWYPFIEGFSYSFVTGLLVEFGNGASTVYDPFAGTGTTVTVACMKGMNALYSEVNPFMRLVVECKSNVLRRVASNRNELPEYLDELVNYARNHLPGATEAAACLCGAFGHRRYYVGDRLREAVALMRAIRETKPPHPEFSQLARLALGSIAVASSEMRRAADLRRRTPRERHPRGYSPIHEFTCRFRSVISDVTSEHTRLPAVSCLGESALDEPPEMSSVDLVITSPPYANGTNYFRNTKLELWLTGFIQSESELSDLRARAMAAGINNVSKKGRIPERISAIEEYASRLDAAAYDSRIPELVRRYFSDTKIWLANVSRLLREGGRLVVDIGDSQFAGVHIPTDELLAQIAANVGLRLEESRPIRTRRSRGGAPLKQVVLVFRNRPRSSMRRVAHSGTSHRELERAAVQFAEKLPHLDAPYCSRAWGHPMHSLCSYQGKLKPAIAHFLVTLFTAPGERVLDPMSGCGTVPLEAFLTGREAVGNDLQELGYILTRAKVERGPKLDVEREMEQLLAHVNGRKSEQDHTAYADFGFNGRLSDYFHRDTFKEILAAREYLGLHPCDTWARAIVYSCLLHLLHGNRPYALSRRSHPVTPFKPSGDSEYRPLGPRLRSKVNRALGTPAPHRALRGSATRSRYQDLPYEGNIDTVITSPPFAASTRFYVANWLRLWFAGWEPDDFRVRQREFLEYQQKRSMDVYFGFFESCAKWLRKGGRLIVHVGRTSSCNMRKELASRTSRGLDLVYSFDEDVKGREKFGIRDQGATTAHQYLFYIRT